MRAVLVGAIAGVMAWPGAAGGHELDEYLQAARVSLARDHVLCEIDLTPGVAIAANIVALVDRNADGQVSPTEAEAYGRSVLRDVTVELDGRAVPLTLTRVVVPSVPEMSDGVGTIQIRAVGTIQALVPGPRPLYFRNDHHPEGSVYLVNALVPDDRHIAVARQVRDPRQHEIRLEYDVRSTTAAQAIWLLGGAFGLSTLIAWRRKSGASSNEEIVHVA